MKIILLTNRMVGEYFKQNVILISCPFFFFFFNTGIILLTSVELLQS